MRFLLEFVPCCGSPTHQRAAESTVLAAEDERWLVPATVITAAPPAPICRSSRKKQRVGATDWKPSLGSISEDSVVPMNTSESPRNITAERDAQKKSSGAGSGAVKVRLRNYSDSYSGSVAMPTIMPTFSPTPFMF